MTTSTPSRNNAALLPDMFEVLRVALNREYADLLPTGGTISRIDGYDPAKHIAPNLYFEKRDKPSAKYIVTITYGDDKQSGCCSCLGETVNDAIKATIAKIGEHYETRN